MIVISKGVMLKNVLNSVKKMGVHIITLMASNNEFLLEAIALKGDRQISLRFTYPITGNHEERVVTVSASELSKSLVSLRGKDGVAIDIQKKFLKVHILSKNTQTDISEFQKIKCAEREGFEKKELPYNQLYLDPIVIASTVAASIAKIKVSDDSKSKESKEAKIPIRGCSQYLSFETPSSNFSMGISPPCKGNFYSVAEDGEVSLVEKFYSLRVPISFLKCIQPIAAAGGVNNSMRFYIPAKEGISFKIVSYFPTDGEHNAVVTLLLG